MLNCGCCCVPQGWRLVFIPLCFSTVLVYCTVPYLFFFFFSRSASLYCFPCFLSVVSFFSVMSYSSSKLWDFKYTFLFHLLQLLVHPLLLSPILCPPHSYTFILCACTYSHSQTFLSCFSDCVTFSTTLLHVLVGLVWPYKALLPQEPTSKNTMFAISTTHTLHLDLYMHTCTDTQTNIHT